MNGGRFEISDIPGMRPSPEEVQRQAELMARGMFPEKFYPVRVAVCPHCDARLGEPHRKGCFMLNPEEFDRRNEEANLLAKVIPGDGNWHNVGNVDVLPAPTEPSPISRLFAAVRGVLDESCIRHVPGINEDAGKYEGRPMLELMRAYDALKLDG